VWYDVCVRYPVPHAAKGAVGYRLEYKGLTFSYAGDCEASTQTVKNSKGVDVLVQETMNTPDIFVEGMGWSELQAKTVLWTKHTPPEAAGKVFSMAKPRLAVTFHHFTTVDAVEPILNAVRTTYDGPLLISQDLTVINVTPTQIVSRMAKVEQRPLVVPPSPEYMRSKGGPQQDLSLIKYHVPEWLQETVIKMDFIEEFKKQVAEKNKK